MNDNIELKNFEINEGIIAKSIYGNEEREFTNQGLLVADDIKKEFWDFLEEYISFTGLQKTTFFRIDAYFDKQKLYILDVNASFVDGWWNALNFARAINQEVNNILLQKFPENFYLQDEVYRPEFKLLLNELTIQWEVTQEVDEIDERNKTYMYWESCRKPNLFPYDWLRIDNKMNLALFSKQWSWTNIEIPEFILANQASWEDISKDYVFKISWKQDMWKGWWKVKVWKPKNWKLWSKLWEENKLVAQKMVSPLIDEQWRNNQAIVMTIENEPIVWYIQKSLNDIINDNSVQWPLVFNNN